MNNISIIIPALNEAEYISKVIGNIYEKAADPAKIDVIVVDNGSEDDTAAIAKANNAFVLEAPEYRGLKYAVLNFGASHAKGEILLFLDADTLLPLHYDEHIKKGLENKDVIGGAFEFSFDKKRLDLLLVTIINRIRYRFRKRFYGDQGVFVLKEIFDRVGGYPPKKILESAYLCKRLQKEGKLKLISKKVTTSSRRFIEGGVLKVFVQDLIIWFKDLTGFETDKYGEAYWALNKPLRGNRK